MFNGVMNGILIFFSCTTAFGNKAFHQNGQVAGSDALGAVMYTCVIWVVNSQLVLYVKYFTVIQHMCIWGSIAIWYLFLLAYGAIGHLGQYSNTAYKVFIEQLAPAVSYWLVTFFVAVAALIPYYSYSTIQFLLFPPSHSIIREVNYLKAKL
jgi:phospholipid-translocating ATPase